MVLTTSPLVKTYTLEEFWDLAEPPDGSKLELIAGVLYLTPPPDAPHNYSGSNLNRLLSGHLHATHNPGWLLVPRSALWTAPATYVEPDLYFISAETAKQIDMDRPNRADLVVEILSPSTSLYDRNTKSDTYAALGVRELWLVETTKKSVEIRVLDPALKQYQPGQVFKRKDYLRSLVLPDVKVQVADIFKRP